MKNRFILGALAYPMMEVLYRGRTHYSMGIAGGLSVLLIDGIRRLPGGFIGKSFLCGAGITGIEYLCGLVWNIEYRVWDYRSKPLNIQGQICLSYSLLWCILGASLMAAMDYHDKSKNRTVQ